MPFLTNEEVQQLLTQKSIDQDLKIQSLSDAELKKLETDLEKLKISNPADNFLAEIKKETAIPVKVSSIAFHEYFGRGTIVRREHEMSQKDWDIFCLKLDKYRDQYNNYKYFELRKNDFLGTIKSHIQHRHQLQTKWQQLLQDPLTKAGILLLDCNYLIDNGRLEGKKGWEGLAVLVEYNKKDMAEPLFFRSRQQTVMQFLGDKVKAHQLQQQETLATLIAKVQQVMSRFDVNSTVIKNPKYNCYKNLLDLLNETYLKLIENQKVSWKQLDRELRKISGDSTENFAELRTQVAMYRQEEQEGLTVKLSASKSTLYQRKNERLAKKNKQSKSTLERIVAGKF